jgi:uncharacterized membrane protein
MVIPTKKLVSGAVIAAIYVALTVPFAPMSFGPIQFRVSEVMTVLPFLMPEAIPGLFIGCLISNTAGVLMGGTTALDIVFGSLATLTAAFLTYKSRFIVLAPLAPVVVNALVIGAMLAFTLSPDAAAVSFPAFAAEIALSELVICYGGGIPLLLALKKTGLYRLGSL